MRCSTLRMDSRSTDLARVIADHSLANDVKCRGPLPKRPRCRDMRRIVNTSAFRQRLPPRGPRPYDVICQTRTRTAAEAAATDIAPMVILLALRADDRLLTERFRESFICCFFPALSSGQPSGTLVVDA